MYCRKKVNDVLSVRTYPFMPYTAAPPDPDLDVACGVCGPPQPRAAYASSGTPTPASRSAGVTERSSATVKAALFLMRVTTDEPASRMSRNNW
jgi:hypothetical protein